MKLLLVMIAALMTTPAMAQQRHQAPASGAAPESGWSRPISGFADAYNATAVRLRVSLRASEVGCNDINIPGPGRMCEYRIGRLIAFVSAKEDRSTIEAIDVYLEGLGQDGAVDELRGAFSVLTQLLEPGAPQTQRAAATSQIQSQMVVLPANSREAVLGSTQFNLVIQRQVRSILRARQAGPT